MESGKFGECKFPFGRAIAGGSPIYDAGSRRALHGRPEDLANQISDRLEANGITSTKETIRGYLVVLSELDLISVEWRGQRSKNWVSVPDLSACEEWLKKSTEPNYVPKRISAESQTGLEAQDTRISEEVTGSGSNDAVQPRHNEIELPHFSEVRPEIGILNQMFTMSDACEYVAIRLTGSLERMNIARRLWKIK